MKVLIGAAAALLFAATAAAQTTPASPSAPTPPIPPSACGELQPTPVLPTDASHATAAQMAHGNQAYGPWATDTHAKLQCREAEVRALQAQANAAMAAYNAQAAAFTNTVNSWTAVTTAYNGQHGAAAASSGHSSRGSALGQHGPN